MLLPTKTKGLLLSQNDMSVIVHHSIYDVSTDWDKAAPNNNIFLQRKYLQLLEDFPPAECGFIYLLFYQKSNPVGVAIGQIGKFNAEDSINESDENEKRCPFSSVFNFIKGLVRSSVKIEALLIGNALLTGEHNVYFQGNDISKTQQIKLVEEAIQLSTKELDKRGRNISLFYIKEYHEDHRAEAQTWVEKKYHEFTAQPDMILMMRPEWETFEDYLAAMSSKYRVRVKRAKKKGKDIVKVPFDAQKIEENLPRIHELYQRIAEKSVFNLVNLNPNYFLELKKRFGDDFRLVGYYIDETLVGYYTTIKNHDELEAHFLGYDQSFNHKHQMYLNILYDIIQVGFEEKSTRINFARTALEIKSSVGAEPSDMFWYLRHRNNFSNKFLAQIVNYINPKEEWVQRKPFKEIKES